MQVMMLWKTMKIFLIEKYYFLKAMLWYFIYIFWECKEFDENMPIITEICSRKASKKLNKKYLKKSQLKVDVGKPSVGKLRSRDTVPHYYAMT